jgi:predicted nucleotidyltransferase
MPPVWQITPEKVQAAISRIVEVCNPRRIILFGSFARGDMHPDSDLDILVVVKNPVENPRKESVRIRRALKGLIMAVDVVVLDEGRLLDLSTVPGLVYREAIREGRTVYESAA